MSRMFGKWNKRWITFDLDSKMLFYTPTKTPLEKTLIPLNVSRPADSWPLLIGLVMVVINLIDSC